MASQYMQGSNQKRRQLQGFVAVWLSVTLLIGIATFVGIYIGTGEFETATASNDGAVIIVSPQEEAVVVGEDSPLQNTTTDLGNTAANTVTETDAGNGDAAVNANTDADASNTGNANTAPDTAPVAQQEGTSTPMPTSTLPPRQESKFDLGIQLIPAFGNDTERMGGYMDAAAYQLNLNWVKLQVRWEFAEPQRGIYDWEALGYDLFFEQAAERNLKVLVSVVSAPDWARQPGISLDRHGPPANMEDFTNFLGALLQRYPARIHAVEVWNEQNLAREWTSTGGLSAADYVEMLRASHDVIRFLDPNIMIISGALAPTGVNDGIVAIDDFVYTDQLIANGVLDYIDCFGAHHNGYNIGPGVPYDRVPNDPAALFRGPFENPNHSWSFYSTLNTYANKIANAGSDIPLCVTEFGWAVSGDLDMTPVNGQIPNFEYANDNTLDEQRMFLVEAIELMQEWDFVRLAVIWNLNFGPEANWDLSREYRDNIPYSLIRPNYIPAPAWAFIADMDFRSRP